MGLDGGVHHENVDAQESGLGPFRRAQKKPNLQIVTGNSVCAQQTRGWGKTRDSAGAHTHFVFTTLMHVSI